MPQSENIQRGIHVTIQDRAAMAAHPFSNPKTLSTFWAAHGTAVGTGLGCEAFRHFTVHHLPRYRFVFKKVTEDRPSGVVHRFGHLRFGQFGTANIAHHNQFTVLCQPIRCFMQKVLATVGDLGVKIPRLSGTTLALMFGYAALLISIPARRLNFAPIRAGRQRFQPQVDSDMLFAGCYGFVWRFTDEIDIPASPRILSESAAFDQAGNLSTLPEPENLPCITNGIAQHLHARGFEGNPSQRPFTAPAQSAFLLLLTARGVFLAHRLHRLRVQAQFPAAARCQLIQIKATGPALIPAHGMLLGVVAEIPDGIDRPRHAFQRAGANRVFNTIPKGFNHLFIIEFSLDSVHLKQRRTPFAALSIPSLKEGVFRANPDNISSFVGTAVIGPDEPNLFQIIGLNGERLPKRFVFDA